MLICRNDIVLALVIVLSAIGCKPTGSVGDQPSGDESSGSARISILFEQGESTSNVARVSVTSFGPDLSSVSLELTSTNTDWSGVIGNMPAGSKLSFLAQAFDSSGTPLYEGQVNDVSIKAKEITLVTITLKKVSTSVHLPPTIVRTYQPPLGNSSSQFFNLFQVDASDPQGGPLSFQWKTNIGQLGVATSANTTSRNIWIAPGCVPPDTIPSISVIVSNAYGLSATTNFYVPMPADTTCSAMISCPTTIPVPPCPADGIAGGFTRQGIATGGSPGYSGYWMRAVREHNRAAVLYDGEIFARFDGNGNVVTPSVGLTTRNPSISPESFGDKWSAFYGSAMAFDGTHFGILRRSSHDSSPVRLYFYRVNPDGFLVGAPLRIELPGTSTFSWMQHAALEWNGDAYFGVIGANDGSANRLYMVRIKQDATLDTSWGNGGVLQIHAGSSTAYHFPQLAISNDGATAGIVWGAYQFELALVDLYTPAVRSTTATACDVPATSVWSGHDIAWNQSRGVFGIGLFADGTYQSMNVQGSLVPLTRTGHVGSIYPVLCGAGIGAGGGGGVTALPNGNFVLAKSNSPTYPGATQILWREVNAEGHVVKTLSSPVTNGLGNGPHADVVFTGTSTMTFLGLGGPSVNFYIE